MRYFLSFFIIFAFLSTASAGFRELFEKEFLSKPWSAERLQQSACIECHTSEIMRVELQKIPEEWKNSWHFKNDVSCHDCHGGDREDATMAMSHKRGFVGSPRYNEVPEFCGKCHIGILKNYLKSGHGKALRFTGTGPNCVTCHGSHNIQRANIDIIYGRRCTQCHSYERAKLMKQALFATESKINELEKALLYLKSKGVYIEDEEKSLFRTEAEFRTLFHTIDASLVRESTDEFAKRLNVIDEKIKDTFGELRFRRNFSVFLMLIFIGIAVVISYLSKTYND